MGIGFASDHGGFAPKGQIAAALSASSPEVLDFGEAGLDPSDDYSGFVIPLARRIAGSPPARSSAA